jgi:hypothetical protein
LSSDVPGRSILRAWNALRVADTIPLELEMTHILPRSKPKPAGLAFFSLLSYITAHWLWRTVYFKKQNPVPKKEIALDSTDEICYSRISSFGGNWHLTFGLGMPSVGLPTTLVHHTFRMGLSDKPPLLN